LFFHDVTFASLLAQAAMSLSGTHSHTTLAVISGLRRVVARARDWRASLPARRRDAFPSRDTISLTL
jgi:hypothetical protein